MIFHSQNSALSFKLLEHINNRCTVESCLPFKLTGINICMNLPNYKQITDCGGKNKSYMKILVDQWKQSQWTR